MRSRSKLSGALLVSCVVGWLSCAQQSVPAAAAKGEGLTNMEASSEVAAIITAWFSAVERGDATWRDLHVSRLPGTRIVGTDPEEFLEGPRAYEFLANEARAVGGKVKIAVQHVEAFVEGSVAWGVALPTITLPDGQKISARWSAVFHREGEQWKLVQLHASLPKGNAESFGEVFPGAPPSNPP